MPGATGGRASGEEVAGANGFEAVDATAAAAPGASPRISLEVRSRGGRPA